MSSSARATPRRVPRLGFDEAGEQEWVEDRPAGAVGGEFPSLVPAADHRGCDFRAGGGERGGYLVGAAVLYTVDVDHGISQSLA